MNVFQRICFFVCLVAASASNIDLQNHILPQNSFSNDGAVITVKATDIVYYFCSQQNANCTGIKSDQINSAKSLLDTKKETLVQVHGWLDGNNSNFNNAVRNAALAKNDINVIIVDWSKVATGEYLIVKSQIPKVAEFAGEFLSNLISILKYPVSSYKLVGHSLGAHIVGLIGKHFNGSIEQIVGLDPAGPFINSHGPDHLQKSDGKFVQVIHTSIPAGMRTNLGHADYYPNGGAKQPGCGLDVVGSCAHMRSFWLYAESLTHNQFNAQQCNSYHDFEAKKCNGIVALMGGYRVDTNATGAFYLDTNSRSPYGRGKFFHH